MQHVRLPIFNEFGIETGEFLQVSVEILERLAKTSVIYKDHVKVVEMVKPTAEEEIEMIDRIIAGLPPKPDYVGPIDFKRNQPTGFWDYMSNLKLEPSAHFVLNGNEVTQHVFPEDVEFKPGPPTVREVRLRPDDEEPLFTTPIGTWRRIPGFNRYRMSPTANICDDNDKSVSIVKGGRFDNVFLWDDNDQGKRMSVDHLFKKTYPEK